MKNSFLPSYFQFWTLFTFIFCLSLISCEKEELDENGNPISESGRFSDHQACQITSVPSELDMNSYYTKYLNCSGIAILGGANTPDEALYRADEIIEFMMQGKDAIRNQLIKEGSYCALYGPDETLSSLPGFSNTANRSAEYQSSRKVAGSPSDNLLCYPYPAFSEHEGVFVHEMAHMIHITGLDNDFDNAVKSAYNNAMSSSKWAGTYASQDYYEYLAEGVEAWYNVKLPFEDDFHNTINTRAELQNYDPELYNLINQHFNNLTDIPSCNYAVTDKAGSCPATISDIDGNVYEVVNINGLCWMKENLKVTRFNDGTLIDKLSNESNWQNANSAAYCHYDNDSANTKYGLLYNSHCIKPTKNICPNGWHIASNQEWNSLIIAGDQTNGNHQFMAQNEWSNASPAPTDALGFSALPAGSRDENGFNGRDQYSYFWSSLEYGDGTLKEYRFIDNLDFIITVAKDKNVGNGCRCVQDY